jgi:uncharacterized protein
VLFLNLQELELRKVRFSLSLAPGQFDLLESRLRQEVPLSVEGGAEVAGPLGEIRVHGHIRGQLETECDRCLEPTSIALDGDFDLLYRPDEELGPGEEREIHAADLDIGFYRGAGIELVDVIREQILLWLPMHPVCRDDCKGICPLCGQVRNQQECGCHSQTLDERWQALKKLRS